MYTYILDGDIQGNHSLMSYLYWIPGKQQSAFKLKLNCKNNLHKNMFYDEFIRLYCSSFQKKEEKPFDVSYISLQYYIIQYKSDDNIT